jgi:RNA polymerase sigma-70 factor (ECF subfamily)
MNRGSLAPFQMTDPNAPVDRTQPTADVVARARAGESRAISTLFRRQGDALRRWAHGRLPRWARTINDTADVVQDALLKTFRGLDRFEDRGRGALQAYLRQAVVNRIRDEMRRVAARPADAAGDDMPETLDDQPSPLDRALDEEQSRQYKQALAALTESERLLVVGRLELGYSYEQLALISGRATAEAARLAVRRAVVKMADTMGRG